MNELKTSGAADDQEHISSTRIIRVSPETLKRIAARMEIEAVNRQHKDEAVMAYLADGITLAWSPEPKPTVV